MYVIFDDKYRFSFVRIQFNEHVLFTIERFVIKFLIQF